MTSTETALLIILAIFLALFLLLAIISAIISIKIFLSVKRVVAKAENVVDSVESAADVFKQASGPLAVLKVIKNIVNLSGHKRKGRDDE
ncbi:MAG TPA: hypothetical protein VLG37_02770 [Candidatus Saccharimonadales bacterium]|nr:hypothetical protein [Candidatus Saccharimonadales bacterium]